MLVYASGQCIEQRSSGCSQMRHSAPPRIAVGLLLATAVINTSVPVGLQLVHSPRRGFARKDLACDYPVFQFRVNAFYYD